MGMEENHHPNLVQSINHYFLHSYPFPVLSITVCISLKALKEDNNLFLHPLSMLSVSQFIFQTICVEQTQHIKNRSVLSVHFFFSTSFSTSFFMDQNKN